MAVLRPVRLRCRCPRQHLYDAANPRHVAYEDSRIFARPAAARHLRDYPSLLVTPGTSFVTVLYNPGTVASVE